MTDFASRRTMMVDTQVRPSDVTKFPIIDAMLKVPRENFVPTAQREAAYMDGNIDLGSGRVLLEPRTLAKMLDALDISNDELVIDIGSAMGYSSAVIAHMAEAVVAVEDEDIMIAEAQETLMEAGIDNVIQHAAPLSDGASVHGPYDVMIVQGGIQELPADLQDQIKEGGRVACIFMQGALGEVRIGYKQDGHISWRMSFNAGAPLLPGFTKEQAFEF
ncbi:protein-L-isoaspartate O-methyltransferase family protein [Roseobacter sp.]|uniref:protein-L-isoaspartate O-methyltransferase family protein n=1 Tax=Roseobacter sp. TaxID=1907202 RepID=UPI00385E8960